MADSPKTTEPSIAVAHEIATLLWDRGFRGPAGLQALGMAMGIYMEAQEGSHRGLQPIASAVCSVAQQTFDAFRDADRRRSANVQ